MSIDTPEWASINELTDGLETGALTSVSLCEYLTARINALDGGTNAVLTLNPGAMDIAETLDAERRAGALRGPLHGVPVMVKDNLDTGDKMATTAGSLALEGTRASGDSHVVARLRAAGALLLGKTNLSEWANFRSVRSSSGWSSAGGQTRNPYALDRTPGGSSSGSGVAVSAGFCPFAVGTETSGSIVNPATMNGIVGIKPTVGLVSRGGIVPISSSQDTAGPMARSVADAAALLSTMSGTDPADPVTAQADRLRSRDYGRFVDLDGLKGKRIGLAVNYCGFDERADAILADAIAAIRSAGAEVLEIELVPVEAIRPYEYQVMLYEFKACLEAYLATRGEDTQIRTLADLVAFNRSHADRVMPYFPQDILEKSLETDGLDSPVYKEARTTSLRLAREDGLDRALNDSNLDAVMAATGCLPWLIDWVNGDNRRGTSAAPAAVAGYPNISVPAGFMYGMPFNVSFMGPAFSEPTLVAIAAGFEHVVQARQKPAFRQSADFTLAPRPCLPSSFSPRKDAPAPW